MIAYERLSRLNAARKLKELQRYAGNLKHMETAITILASSIYNKIP